MQLASLFQDHAVLQRNIPIPVWGTGTPGEAVTVHLAGHDEKAEKITRMTKVDSAGRWSLRLPPMKEGGPYRMTAEAPSGTAEADDLLVGEVWICSGQSNMEWTLEKVENDPASQLQPFPQIRLLSVINPAERGRADAIVGNWKVATPEALAEFSAVGGYFGRFLHGELDVPVGLICNAWGGTRVQAWISREGLVREPEGRDEIAYYESYLWLNGGGRRLKTFEEWELEDVDRSPVNLGLERGWASRDFDDSAWRTMDLPGFWQHRGHGHSGVFWFRKTVEIPVAWAGKDLELSLGAIDKHDETWVNGELVGSTGWEIKESWSVPRLYRIGSAQVKAGGLAVAVRARSHVFAGGLTGPGEKMWLAPEGCDPAERIPLHGLWRYCVEHDWGITTPPALIWGPGNPNTPSILFDNRVAPLIPYGFRGVIWYQGESNVGEANLYKRLLPAMIEDWRRAWGAGNFPFIQVQLANHRSTFEEPTESTWAALREAQAAALSLEATGLAVAIDIGDAADIHPRNKRDVGLRLAQSALHNVYGQPSAPLCPVFAGMTIEEGAVRCTFQHTGGPLAAKGGLLRHFALAGIDRVFHWAEATIEGETVLVSSPKVPRPYAVRYAWADNPDGCNLVSSCGLPVAPFRSDSWPVT